MVELRIMQEPKETQEGNPRGAPKPHQPKISLEARLWGWRQGSKQEARAKRGWEPGQRSVTETAD